MKKIITSNKKAVLVDDEDYDYLSQFSWCAAPTGRNREYFYIIRNRRNLSPMSMHREIMNAKKGEIIDHINGNQLDNRRSNLRRCTKSENKRNSLKCTRASKGKQYKGIGFEKRYGGTYWAAVYVDGKKIYKTGKFKTPEQAARAYDELAIQYYGEFANLNFPLSRSNDEVTK